MGKMLRRCLTSDHRKAALCGLVLTLVMLFAGQSALAQSPPSDELSRLIERIEKLEVEKQDLSRRLETVERAGPTASDQQIPDLPAATGVAAFDMPTAAASAEPPEAGAEAAASAARLDAQGKQLSALQKAVKAFQDKASEKKYPNLQMNGVFQADAGWIHQDEDSLNEFGRIEDGSGFRRARLSAKGSVAEHTNYLFQFDLGTGGIGRPTITDIWVEQGDVPYLGTVRAGQWKQPFSLEVVSSFRYTTFMERSSLFQAFTPFRRLGVGFYDQNADQTMTWAVSGFRSGQDQYGDTYSNNSGYGTSERVTFLPYWEDEGQQYLHLGVGHFFNAPVNGVVNFRSIPELFVGAQGNDIPVGSSGQPIPGPLNGVPFFVQTGNLNVNVYNVVGTELLWVKGAFSLQSEAMVNFVDQSGGNPMGVLPGMYAQAGYFLTGEHRPYDRKAGAIDRVIPHQNMKFCGDNGNGYGFGAWEVAARFSYLDLNDENIRGGTLTDYTVGVNWYMNPYLKTAFNWVHAIADNAAFPKSQTDLFGIRAQVDF